MTAASTNNVQHTELQVKAQSFGAIKRTYATPPAAFRDSASNDPRFLNSHSEASELVAQSRRAASANGFGDADAATVALPVRPSRIFAPGDSPLLYKTAGMRDLIATASGWVAGVARRAYSEWCRRQMARATYRTLRQLDARTLRDLGLSRAELSSTAYELSGQAEATRVRSLKSLHYLPI
jgi:uncharacterized protein YjiS (DUF1127 family)